MCISEQCPSLGQNGSPTTWALDQWPQRTPGMVLRLWTSTTLSVARPQGGAWDVCRILNCGVFLEKSLVFVVLMPAYFYCVDANRRPTIETSRAGEIFSEFICLAYFSPSVISWLLCWNEVYKNAILIWCCVVFISIITISCNYYTMGLLTYHGFVQERRNSSALAMELHLSCSNPSIYSLQSLQILQTHLLFVIW